VDKHEAEKAKDETPERLAALDERMNKRALRRGTKPKQRLS